MRSNTPTPADIETWVAELVGARDTYAAAYAGPSVLREAAAALLRDHWRRLDVARARLGHLASHGVPPAELNRYRWLIVGAQRRVHKDLLALAEGGAAWAHVADCDPPLPLPTVD